MRPRSLVQSHYEPVNFTLVQGHDPSLTPFIHSSQTEANVQKETWPSPTNESGGKCCHYLRKENNPLIPHSLLMQGKRIKHKPHSFTLSEFSSSFNIRTRATSSLIHPINSEFSSFSTPTGNMDHFCAHQICCSIMLLLMCVISLQ